MGFHDLQQAQAESQLLADRYWQWSKEFAGERKAIIRCQDVATLLRNAKNPHIGQLNTEFWISALEHSLPRVTDWFRTP